MTEKISQPLEKVVSKKFEDEILKGCEHDGSYIPVPEVRRLINLSIRKFFSKEEIPTVDDLIKYNHLTKNFMTLDNNAKKEAIKIHRKLRLLLKKLEEI